MKVAIAGTGPVAHYLIEEFGASGLEVVVLTRNLKSSKAFEQRQTDYSIKSLVSVLEDCDVLVSTVADYGDPSKATKVHLDMLEACKQSKKCKSYIPSEWTLNAEDYPEQPMFFAEGNKALHEKLKQEKSVQWTIICNSWFVEYVVPRKQRYIRDIDQLWPMNYDNKVFTIYGPGTQIVNFTSVRDVARAVAVLINSKEPWEPYTYLSGEQMSWNDLFATLKRWDSGWTSQNKPLAESIQQIVDNKSPESVMAAQFEIQSYSGALTFPDEKIKRQRAKYFGDIHFRSVEDILTEAATRRDEII